MLLLLLQVLLHVVLQVLFLRFLSSRPCVRVDVRRMVVESTPVMSIRDRRMRGMLWRQRWWVEIACKTATSATGAACNSTPAHFTTCPSDRPIGTTAAHAECQQFDLAQLDAGAPTCQLFDVASSSDAASSVDDNIDDNILGLTF